jgi:hypothetical protein
MGGSRITCPRCGKDAPKSATQLEGGVIAMVL